MKKCKDCGGRDGHMPYCPGGIDRMTRPALSNLMAVAMSRAAYLHGGDVSLTGSTRTIRALQRRGFVNDLKITDAGYKALGDHLNFHTA
jgi:hypothetical protein